MKKILLFSALGMLAVPGIMAQDGSAEKNYLLPNFYTMQMSPSGKYIGSQDMMGISLWNTETNEYEAQVELDDEEFPGAQNYSIGNGNFVNDLGQFVGSVSYGSVDEAYIWKDGAWKPICTLNEERTSNANGITNDGTRACGYATGKNNLISSVRPVYWDLQEDGSWKIGELPYPSKDFTGQEIQGCTTISISNDGKTIVGNIVNNDGMCPQPIIWYQGYDGEWYYQLLGMDVINPTGIEIPACPVEPDATAYMTGEEKVAWLEAMAAWRENPFSERPQVRDYISDADQLARYEAAMATYNEQMDAFEQVCREITNTGSQFVQNNFVLSDNGKFVGSTFTHLDEDWNVTYNIWVYDVEKETAKSYSLPGLTVITCLLNDGTVLGGGAPDMFGGTPQMSFILPKDADEFMPLADYIKEQSQEAYDFAEENFTHEYIVDMDPETWDYVLEEKMALGLCWMSQDHSLLSGCVLRMWMDDDDSLDDEVWVVGYVMHLSADNSGVNGVAVDNSADAPVEYYTLDGIRINTPAPGQIVIRRQAGKAVKMVAE